MAAVKQIRDALIKLMGGGKAAQANPPSIPGRFSDEAPSMSKDLDTFPDRETYYGSPPDEVGSVSEAQALGLFDEINEDIGMNVGAAVVMPKLEKLGELDPKLQNQIMKRLGWDESGSEVKLGNPSIIDDIDEIPF